MKITKVIKDYIIKLIRGNRVVPIEVLELHDYFRYYNQINFTFKKGDNGRIIAISKNFRHGSIVTSAKNSKELEKNIRDAILTAFDVPSVYQDKVKLNPVGKFKKEYALA